MKKQVNFLISCFFLASLAFFVSTGKIHLAKGLESFDFTGGGTAYANFDEEYIEAQRRAIERELNVTLSRILAEAGIFPNEICTNVNISDKYSISINEIRLVFDAKGEVENQEEIEAIKTAAHIVQKEVGDDILITGEFKMRNE